jgi:hypothetical protein
MQERKNRKEAYLNVTYIKGRKKRKNNNEGKWRKKRNNKTKETNNNNERTLPANRAERAFF